MLYETAYAKVNLALHVRARRDDGYHSIESLFAFAEDGDELCGNIRRDGQISLSIDGPFAAGLDTGPGNLVIRAARALRSFAGIPDGADLSLTKNLPVASGIGGGSADAAATLRLLVRLWNLSIAPSDLFALALSLGSDVPACLASSTQRVGGRGERVETLAIAGLADMAMLLVNPNVPVSTAAIFTRWDGIDRGPLKADDLATLIADGRNDLEEPAIGLAPEISATLAAMRSLSGTRMVRMSGSGATCFALFDDPSAMADAAHSLRAKNAGWWVMETKVRSQ